MLGPSLLFVLARLLLHDRVWPLPLWDAYTFVVYTPAYVALLSSAVFRRWLLVAAGLFVVGWHLAWVLPDYQGAEPIPAAALAGPRLRVFSANLLLGNPTVGIIIREALDADADVIVLVEFTPEAEAAAREMGIDERYPYHIGHSEAGFYGNAIYSRWPMEDAGNWLAGPTPETRATIVKDGARLRIYGMHTIAPTAPGPFKAWNQNFESLLATTSVETGPLLLIGDFNLTQHHRWYGDIEEAGFSDCHVARGKGSATTWPNGHGHFLPIRLDQAFARGGAVCLDIREGRGEGSDHRPVIVDIGLAP